MDQFDLDTVLAAFGFSDFAAIPYGNGHINDTYLVTQADDTKHILQRINHAVFTKPEELIENMDRVLEHLSQKTTGDVERRVLRALPVVYGGGSSFIDDAGNTWRMLNFIDGATSYDVITAGSQAFEAAKGFGEFLRDLSDLPEPPLHSTIPDFHDVSKRLATFRACVDEDKVGRAESCRSEIDFLLQNVDIATTVEELVSSGEIPVRTCHNDTKLNNVLLDNTTQNAVCVIDLDTCMPGLSLYDFGDLVRTSTSPVAEDCEDSSLVAFDLEIFRLLVNGYLAGTGEEVLTSAEKENLPFAGKLMAYIMGLRFLTDFLNGDVYYKTDPARPNHNLDRCRTQVALIVCMEAQRDEIAYLCGIIA